MSRFQRAQRSATPMKLGLMGVSGSGKTYSAIRLAHGLAGGDPDKILVVDTENSSAALYATLNGGFLHEVIRPPFTPRKYIDLIRTAASEGMRVVVLDSATHAWEYILSYKEELDRKGGNGYTNWGKAKPLFRELKDAILQSPLHVICCMRAKADYAIEESEQGGNRKSTVKKLGTSAIVEPGMEYEFSVVWNLDRDTNLASVEKDRTNLFQGRVETITEEHGQRILSWLGVAADDEFQAGEDWGRLQAGESEDFAQAQAEAEATKNGQAQWKPLAEDDKKAIYEHLAMCGIERESRAMDSYKAACAAFGVPFLHAARSAMEAGVTNQEELFRRVSRPPAVAPEAPEAPAEPPAEAEATKNGAVAPKPRKSRAAKAETAADVQETHDKLKEAYEKATAESGPKFELSVTEMAKFQQRCKLAKLVPDDVMDQVWRAGGRTYADLTGFVNQSVATA